jgi:hypothetical protein
MRRTAPSSDPTATPAADSSSATTAPLHPPPLPPSRVDDSIPRRAIRDLIPHAALSTGSASRRWVVPSPHAGGPVNGDLGAFLTQPLVTFDPAGDCP